MKAYSREFAGFITPEDALDTYVSSTPAKRRQQNDDLCIKDGLPPMSTIAYWRHLQKKQGMCEVCEIEPVWRYGGADMCFACTTGESNPSGDYELEYPEGEPSE